MKPYIPFYHRQLNTFIRYEEREFTLECGKKGMERVAIYKDRNGKIKEEIAHGMSKEILRRLKDGEVFYENGVKIYKIDEDFYGLEYNINSTFTNSDLMKVRVLQFELLESEFDKWEDYKEDKYMDLLIESIEEDSGAWCWAGYKYNNLSLMVFINGYNRDRKVFVDQDLNEWKYVKPVKEKDLENLKEELLC